MASDILIVDDQLDNLHLLSDLLTQQGYEVRTVTRGSAALMGVEAQLPDLILLDIFMPEMNGYEVCQRLKDNSKTREIPVIFISALNEVFDKVKAFTVGGVDYVTKPFQIEEVFARIETQLSLRRMQVQLQAQNTCLQQTERELEAALAQSRSLNQRVEEMTAIEERNRIARDIHDSLGHILVALNIQMGAALSLWSSSPQESYEFLARAKTLGSEALNAVRQSVSAIRSDPLEGPLFERAIASLVENFHQSTGITPECIIDISHPVHDAINRAVYRLVQEGLTNICKHAEASAVQIRIQTTIDELLLTLTDNGRGFCSDETATGYGLHGMKERAIALGGQLDIVSKPGSGCWITAKLPRMEGV
ncbi:MAG: response regulator [Acaryochloridaceae cyanobacterium RU_4_10]|nr:response regulator [Acaryochloridaceae cyanobacterium RU_4_10]